MINGRPYSSKATVPGNMVIFHYYSTSQTLDENRFILDYSGKLQNIKQNDRSGLLNLTADLHDWTD